MRPGVSREFEGARAGEGEAGVGRGVNWLSFCGRQVVRRFVR